MRYLKPSGSIEIKKKWYNIVFTLDVIDELQDIAKMPIDEFMILVTKKKTMRLTIEILLKCLLNQKVELEEDKIEYYSISLISAYIEQMKYKKIPGEIKPEPDEEVKHEFIDIEYLFYYLTVVLGYSEEEAWNMTLGKIGTLQMQHAKHNGWIKEDALVDIMSIGH